jgi:type IV pilus assembly protein PilN
MIRINLLGARVQEKTIKVPGPGGGAPSQGKTYLLAFVVLGGTVGFIGWQYMTASQQIRKLDQEIKSLTEEKARLQAIIAQVNEYEQRVKRLEEKEKLIERLKRERTGPVHVLDELSAQLPDFIWLTGLTQAAGTVTVDGMAASYVSIADYIRKLEDTVYFQNVELVDARQEKDYTKFQLRSQIVTPPAEPSPAAAAAPAPAAAPGPGSK